MIRINQAPLDPDHFSLRSQLVEYLVHRFALPDEDAKLNYQTTGRYEHLIDLSGGLRCSIGMSALLIGFKQAGDAVSYGLSQGVTIVSAFFWWGVFLEKVYRGATCSQPLPLVNEYRFSDRPVVK